MMVALWVSWPSPQRAGLHGTGKCWLEQQQERLLVYAAVLLRPHEAFFNDPAWPEAADGWQAEYSGDEIASRFNRLEE